MENMEPEKIRFAEMLTPSTVRVLNVLWKYHPNELNITQIQEYSGMSRPTVYQGVRHCQTIGFVKKRSAGRCGNGEINFYSLMNEDLKKALDDIVSYGVSFKQKTVEKRFRAQKITEEINAVKKQKNGPAGEI